MSRTSTGALLVLLSASGFSTMPIFALFAYENGINVATLLCLRFSLAALIMFALLFIRGKFIWPDRKHLGALFILGSIFYAMQSSLYLSAVRYISPGLAALVLYTYPVFVALLSVLFCGEVMTPRLIIALLMSLAGVTMILGLVGADANPLGIGLALAAAVVYSGYIVAGNRLIKQVPTEVASAFIAMFAMVTFVVTGGISGQLHMPSTPAAWWPVWGLTLLATVLAMLTFFAGMERIGSTRASILSTTEPFMTALLSSVLLGQNLTLTQALGGLAVVAGAVLVVLPQPKLQFSTGVLPACRKQALPSSTVSGSKSSESPKSTNNCATRGRRN